MYVLRIGDSGCTAQCCVGDGTARSAGRAAYDSFRHCPRCGSQAPHRSARRGVDRRCGRGLHVVDGVDCHRWSCRAADRCGDCCAGRGAGRRGGDGSADGDEDVRAGRKMKPFWRSLC